MNVINSADAFVTAGIASGLFVAVWLVRTIVAERRLGVGSTSPLAYVRAPRAVLGYDIALWVLGFTALIATVLAMAKVLTSQGG